MKIATAAAVAVAVVCPASADTRISLSHKAEVGAATSRVIELRRARGGSVVRSSVDTDVERAIATLTFDLAAYSSQDTEVTVPIRVRGGARVIGMAVTAGGEALITNTLQPAVAWRDYRRLTAPEGPATDPALLTHVATRGGFDELALRVFPLTKDRGAHIELTVALPTDGWAISEPEEPYVSREVALLAVEPPRKIPPIVFCGIGLAHHNGELDKAIIRRYVKRNIPRVRGCYERGLLSNAALAGSVDLHFSIGPDGRTSNVSVDGALDAPAVRACIAEDLERWEFPVVPDGGNTRVNYPLTLVAAGS